MKIRMRLTAATAVALLGAGAVVLPAVASSASASTLPGSSPGTAAATKFSGCLVANTHGIHTGLNKVAWQGMKAAEAAEPSKVTVRRLASAGASAYVPNIDTFLSEKCGLIITVGPLMASATESAAKANPKAKFAIVACTYKSGCLTGNKLKNITSVKGSATAVKTLVLARA